MQDIFTKKFLKLKDNPYILPNLKMMKVNYHSHTLFSDGSNSLEELINAVIDQGFTSFGISDHSPVPFPSDWNMKFEQVYGYYKNWQRLKNKYKDKIDLYFGFEADFIPNLLDFSLVHLLKPDYIIGAVHYYEETLNGNPFNLDKSVETFVNGLNQTFACNVEDMVLTFYDNVIKLIETQKFDILAHLNLIEKFNYGNRFFDPMEKWYQDKVKEVLNAVKSKNIIIELNARSRYKKLIDDFSPSDWIVKEARKLDIPFVISGDVHKIEELSIFWDDAVKNLKQNGYNQILVLKNGKWEYQKI